MVKINKVCSYIYSGTKTIVRYFENRHGKYEFFIIVYIIYNLSFSCTCSRTIQYNFKCIIYFYLFSALWDWSGKNVLATVVVFSTKRNETRSNERFLQINCLSHIPESETFTSNDDYFERNPKNTIYLYFFLRLLTPTSTNLPNATAFSLIADFALSGYRENFQRFSGIFRRFWCFTFDWHSVRSSAVYPVTEWVKLKHSVIGVKCIFGNERLTDHW